jgi:16S rRNA U1498 N3-methylase RsmE
MPLQHAENLLRRYKGQVVTIKTLSGAIHQGRLTEITNDFVELVVRKEEPGDETVHVFLLFQAMESVIVPNLPASG